MTVAQAEDVQPAAFGHNRLTKPRAKQLGPLLQRCSRSRSPVRIAGGDAALPQLGGHGGVVDVQVLADSGQRPAKAVEPDGVVDLAGSEATAAHLYITPMEDRADCSPVDAEPIT